MVPLFRGLGYGMLTVRLFVNIYYVVIQAWSLFYLGVGFTSELPWGSCEQDFTTNDCYTVDYDEGCNNATETFYEQRCVGNGYYCTAHDYEDGYDEATGNCVGRNPLPSDTPADLPLSDVLTENSISPAEDYFNGFVLGLTIDKNGTTRTFEEFGSIRQRLCDCLVLGFTE